MTRHTFIRRIPLLLLAVLAAGCDDTTQPPAGTPVLTTDFSSQQFVSQSQGFEVELRLDRTRYRPGESAQMTVVIRNVSTRAITFSYSGQRYDFAVSDSTGQTVWRWSDGQTFGGVGQETVAPGDSLAIAEQSWDLRDRNGAPLPVDSSFSMVAETLAYARPPFVTYPHLEFTTRMIP